MSEVKLWQPWQTIDGKLVVNTDPIPSGDVLVLTEPAWTGEAWAGSPVNWQCSGCLNYFSGGLLKVCPKCGKQDYWTGSHAFNSPHGQTGSPRAWMFRRMDEDRELVCGSCGLPSENRVEPHQVGEACESLVYLRPRRFFLVTPDPEKCGNAWPDDHEGLNEWKPRPNVILTLPCADAATAERLLTEADKVRGLFGDVAVLATEAFDFVDAFGKAWLRKLGVETKQRVVSVTNIKRDVGSVILTPRSASMREAAERSVVELLTLSEDM